MERLRSRPLAYCPPDISIECGTILAHLLRRCTRLLMVLPSRQQSAMCSIMSCEDGSHITSTPPALRCLEGNLITSTPPALWCLEGTTLSNRGQRPRIRALLPNLCLEGSTPEDMLSFLPRIIRMERRSPVVTSVIRQKPQKPLAVDARCLLRAIDAVSV